MCECLHIVEIQQDLIQCLHNDVYDGTRSSSHCMQSLTTSLILKPHLVSLLWIKRLINGIEGMIRSLMSIY